MKKEHEKEMEIRKLLEDFVQYLLDKSYVDSDVYSEEPTAIDGYIKAISKVNISQSEIEKWINS